MPESLYTSLIEQVPAATAVIVIVVLFLKFLAEERSARAEQMREATTLMRDVLSKNTEALHHSAVQGGKVSAYLAAVLTRTNNSDSR